MSTIEWWKVSIEKGWDKKQRLPIKHGVLNAAIQGQLLHDVQITPKIVFKIPCPICKSIQLLNLPVQPNPEPHICTECGNEFHTQLF